MLRISRLIALLFLLPVTLWAQSAEPFFGTYAGQAEVQTESGMEQRDMSVTIAPVSDGFSVEWTSVITRSDGRTRQGSYQISFQPSQRDGIYGSAMKTNVFGKNVPLDPLAGEPFVWARLEGDTLSVFSLFINEAGAYEMQEYHRTLADGGLDLVFRRVRDAEAQREIRTFLERMD